MYSNHNEGKPVVAEIFIRTLENKTYKYMTPVSKNVYSDKLGDIFHKYNHRYHSTIKMKPLDVKPNTYFDFGITKIMTKTLNLMMVTMYEY